MKSIILTHSSCGLINYFNTLPPKKPSAPTPYPLPQQGKLSAVFFRHRTDFNVGALKIKLVSYSHTHLFLALHEKRRWPIWISKYGRSKFILSGCFRDAQTGFILATFRFANVGRLSLVLLFLLSKTTLSSSSTPLRPFRYSFSFFLIPAGERALWDWLII